MPLVNKISRVLNKAESSISYVVLFEVLIKIYLVLVSLFRPLTDDITL